jgi:hypothetical protein
MERFKPIFKQMYLSEAFDIFERFVENVMAPDADDETRERIAADLITAFREELRK